MTQRISRHKLKIAGSLLGWFLVMLVFDGCKGSHKDPGASMVILIGIDGLSISGFQQAETPNLDRLVRNGALSFNTRSVMPSISAPNWASHLTGAGPEQHGVTFNGWTPSTSLIPPVESDAEGFFPSVFSVIKQQKPEATTGLFYDWDELADLFNPAFIDHSQYSKNWKSALDSTAPWIIENRPLFTFLYIGYPDEAGHAHHWGSEMYLTAIEEVDSALGVLFNRLEEAGLFDKITFVVVSDHGGNINGHGGVSIEEMEVPWIISGPGIIRDRMISQSNNVFNTASTIVRLLDLQQPESWIGKPVRGAFEGSDEAARNITAYVPQPVSSMQSGIYIVSDTVSFTVNSAVLKIRYTLNGADPNLNSALYEHPILLLKSSVVKAAGFDGEHRSRITTVDFVLVKPIRNIELVHAPNERYAGSGVFTLADQQVGTGDYKDKRWLGFEGVDLEANIMLSEMTDVSRIMLGYLSNPGAWIFAPDSISIMGSVDGVNYVQIGQLNKEQIKNQDKRGRNQIIIPLLPSKLRYLRVFAINTGVCPPGHPGEGNPAWLFADEIMVQ